MNTHMFTHPLTAKQLKMVAEELGYEVHGPIGKKLACGDIGLFLALCNLLLRLLIAWVVGRDRSNV